jgi:serine/threonine protein kinase
MLDFSKITDKYDVEYCDEMINLIQNLTSIDPSKRVSILEVVTLFDGNLNIIQSYLKKVIPQEFLKQPMLNDVNLNQSQDSIKKIESSFESALDPKELQSEREIVLESFKKNGGALQFASKEHQNDSEIVFEAVKQHGFSLKYASKELQNDKKIVLGAVKQYGLSLEFASKELQRDKEIVLEAVKKNGSALQFASKELQSDTEIVLEAVKQYGAALKYVSKELQSNKEIVLEAVKQYGLSLDYASQELQSNKQIVLEAVKKNGGALLISEKFQNDKEVVLEAVKQDGFSLEYASIELQNDEQIVLEAVKTDEGVLLNAPIQFQRDKKFILKCFKNSKYSFIYSPFFNDEEFCYSLIKESIENFNFISPLLKLDEKFLFSCLKVNFNIFNYFDENIKKNQKFILEAMKVNIECLKYISDSLKDDLDFGIKLVQINGNCLEFLSNNLRNNVEVVKVAIETYLVKKKEKLFAEKNNFGEMNLLFSEFSKLFTLDHENIFKIYEILQDSNEITGFTLIRIIMELYDGDLLEFIEKFEMNQKLIIHFGIQILKGLKYLHTNGIIHGDLKLENIFYLKNENGISLKIGDFGTNNIKKYEFYGSMLNIAPEVIVDNLKHNEKSDIFSFGGVLLRMMNLTDRVLYINSLERMIHFDVEEKFTHELKDLVINLLSPIPQERMNIDEIMSKLMEMK